MAFENARTAKSLRTRYLHTGGDHNAAQRRQRLNETMREFMAANVGERGAYEKAICKKWLIGCWSPPLNAVARTLGT